jgi:hypothetical protein
MIPLALGFVTIGSFLQKQVGEDLFLHSQNVRQLQINMQSECHGHFSEWKEYH